MIALPGKISYIDEVDINLSEKIEKKLTELPLFISLYFNAKQNKLSTKTLAGYAYDLTKFFNWAISNVFENKTTVQELTLSDYESITEYDISRYIIYLQNAVDNHNSNITIRRKISSLSSVFKYFYDRGYIDDNPCKYVEYPNFVAMDSNYLTDEQIKKLLAQIKENKNNVYTKKQLHYLEKTKDRDYTIIALLLSTGLRVNECVALDISAIDFQRKIIHVYRGVDIQLPVNDGILTLLKDYIKKRKEISCDTNALFLSMQNKRLCIQAVEDMIKKYGEPLCLPYVLTPKVFRYTFAVKMFQTSANIDLVNSYLGKKKVTEIRILMNHLTAEQEKTVYTTINNMYREPLK